MNFQSYTEKINMFMKSSFKDNTKRFQVLNAIISEVLTNKSNVYWEVLAKGKETILSSPTLHELRPSSCNES